MKRDIGITIKAAAFGLRRYMAAKLAVNRKHRGKGKEAELLKDRGLIAPNFINHQGGFGRRLGSGVLNIAGIRFDRQWTEKEWRAFLNGWQIKFARQ